MMSLKRRDQIHVGGQSTPRRFLGFWQKNLAGLKPKLCYGRKRF